ncbi:MAG: hypothetical protein ACKOVB_17090 [Terrabacter sp.]
MASSRSKGLSIGYRIGYRLRMIGLTLFGPAQLGEGNDPKARLVAERQTRLARARAEQGSHD